MDPYTNPDAQSERTQEAMITRLEERAQHPLFLQMIHDYALLLPRERPLRVLDLGCGTGVAIRHLAATMHPDSTLHGADVSAVLLSEGRRQDTAHRIHWDHLRSGELPYTAGFFDAVVMHTLLSHVPEPTRILEQARRVLKPEGQLIVFDADHAGTTYGQPTYEQTRKIDFLLTSAIATNPDICRQLPRLLHETGFRLARHQSYILSECGQGDYWLSSVHGFIKMLPALNVLTPEEGDAWGRHMLDSHENHTFFASGNFYTFAATC